MTLNIISALLRRATLCDSPAAAAVAATCSSHLQRCCLHTSSSHHQDEKKHQSSDVLLTPEQQNHVETLRYLVSRPLQAANNAALLTALTASYRDLFLVMDQFHKKDILGIPHPLLDDPPSSGQQQQQMSKLDRKQKQQQQQQQKSEQVQPQLNHTQMSYPQRDLTLLPDEPPPAGGFYSQHLQEEYMGSGKAYAQVLPNHLEVNYTVNSFVFLWPPMEVFYPFLADPVNMLRYLKPHSKIKRVSRSQKLKKVRSSLGWRRKMPYHKQRVFGMPKVPAELKAWKRVMSQQT